MGVPSSLKMNYVLIRLQDFLSGIPKSHEVFGPLKDGQLRMPISDQDARKLTWEKWIYKRSNEIINDPSDDESCWYVASISDDGTHSTKLSATGGKNKWQTHRVIKMLQDVTCYTKVNSRSTTDHLMHLCHRGKGRRVGDPVCVNPFHCSWGTAQVNQDQKGCNYGAAFLCPHDPKCIFTFPDTGKRMPCRNRHEFLRIQCDCSRPCFPTHRDMTAVR